MGNSPVLRLTGQETTLLQGPGETETAHVQGTGVNPRRISGGSLLERQRQSATVPCPAYYDIIGPCAAAALEDCSSQRAYTVRPWPCNFWLSENLPDR